MATNEDRPSLLSKVAMFVRNPTKDWSELDQIDQPDDSGYDKQALKAMIERKRQNDFVRRREFDQLRKLRNRDPGAVAAAARPSFFQTSIPTDPDGRAVTLKKIDEIEAQMSKQWWKGKQEAAAQEASVSPPSNEGAANSTAASTLAPGVSVDPFAPTSAAGLDDHGRPPSATDFAPTEMGSGMVPVNNKVNPGRGTSGPPPVVAGSAAALGIDNGFSASNLFAIDSDEMATDPELEEAAIRFANGDDAGAESGLLEALRSDQAAADVAVSWAAALFDLYRATGNRNGFDRAMEEISGRFQNLNPVWFSIADAAAQAVSASAPIPVASSATAVAGKPIWSTPATLTLVAMEQLREVLGTQPMPWHLDWSRLDQVDADAMPLLGGLFSSLCDEPVSLRFTGAEQLIQTLRSMTPSGDRGVEMSTWQIRMDVLRTMRMQDEFELAALDYCVTYEVSPPGWLEARCQFEDVTATVNSQFGDKGIVMTAPMGLDDGSAATVDLRGEILGDATQALAALDAGPQSENIVISCAALVRVDFSAAGSILNWVATRQASGSHVQFRDVHRLVAAFFSVIGINEHARIVPRTM